MIEPTGGSEIATLPASWKDGILVVIAQKTPTSISKKVRNVCERRVRSRATCHCSGARSDGVWIVRAEQEDGCGLGARPAVGPGAAGSESGGEVKRKERFADAGIAAEDGEGTSAR